MDQILDWLFCKCSNQSSIVFPNFASPVTTGMELVDLNINETIYFTCYSVFNGSYAKQIIMLREKKNKDANQIINFTGHELLLECW